MGDNGSMDIERGVGRGGVLGQQQRATAHGDQSGQALAQQVASIEIGHKRIRVRGVWLWKWGRRVNSLTVAHPGVPDL